VSQKEARGKRQEAGGGRQEARGRWARLARYGSNAVVLSLATIGIVIMVNVLAARYYRRFDVTQARLHSLSPQSLQVLSELEDGPEGEIEVIGFYPDGRNQRDFERWLDEYRSHTKAIHYRTVDPIRQPGEAERLGWDVYGAGLLVRRGDRSQQVLYPDEQDITSALLKTSRTGPKVVYFLSGHNERSPIDYDGGGYGNVAALLESNNLQVRSLNLAVTGSVPDDAALLVIAGPRTPFLPGEEQQVQAYLLAGGKALILVDPAPAERAGATSINNVLKPWRVGFGSETVVDPEQSLGGDPLTPALTGYGFHQITKDLANTLIALPLAAPIQLSDVPAPGAPGAGAPIPGLPEEEARYSVLAATSEGSWGESNVQEEPLQYDEGADSIGPLIVAAAIKEPVLSESEEPVLSGGEGTPATTGKTTTRLVLIGDSDLARNDVLAQIPNGQYLLLNAANWLAEEEALIAIGPKTNLPQNIRLNRIQETAVSLVTLALIPAAIALAGFAVWFRRQRPRRPRNDKR
jgi:ABC-type uncharacterized transport system involved in gliding motility auxiliary subunit